MKEYKVVQEEYDTILERKINELAKEGWEVDKFSTTVIREDILILTAILVKKIKE